MESLNILIIMAITLLLIFLYLKLICYTYWKRRGLDYIEPEFYYGNARKMIKGEMALGEQFLEFYKELKARRVRHGGIYILFRPLYIPVDLEIIKNIFQKDFIHFVNHGMYVNEQADPLTGNLFNLEDAKWKTLRTKLTPTFTSGKMKMMFQTLVACTDELEGILNDYSIIQDPVDIKDVLARFTIDVIGSCAFGLDCNSLNNSNSEFRQFSRKIFLPSFIRRMKQLIVMLIPRQILIKVGFKLSNKEIESFFMNVVRETVDYREKNRIFRKDFMHLLLQLKNRGNVTDDESIVEITGSDEKSEPFLTMNELAAQCFVFFVAGFETSATTMTFALYELSENQEIQEKLRKEIVSVLKRHDNKITYDSVMEMDYLDKVINETLRKHPPFPGIPRVCSKDYHIPDTNIVIKSGTRVHIPVFGIHRDPEYYPHPEVFDPERFREGNKAKRPPFAFIPFGEGPRICIGLRFGMMQTKVGLATIISRFKVTLNEKTKTPIKLDNASFVLGVKGGVWLNVSKVERNR